ncbi:serine hydrolase domain-containing protein [Pelomonas sp. SE-A7]|uniref:serine hydrolase domain-containing protein n=1 Tax=Pelomonas sp. SE-A7 TaxID=3054953 RepID=UPI00259D14A4|nr:serine hydrolase domain-containing protein [Pelomonas sp. SE-A7]MDM4765920.1 serine hydrolase domain-containing protein [Pelomonas sp. SE-A7]
MSELQRRQLLMALGAWGAGSLAGAADGKDEAAELRQALQALQADPANPLPGLAVLCVRRGEVVFEAQFGERVVAAEGRPGLPVTPDTLFRIASVTKLVVALGVMRLVEAGRLSLDEDVSERLGFRFRNPRFPDIPITLRLLLSHRAGLTDEGGIFFELPNSLEALLGPQGSIGAKAWASWAPGGHFQYTNLNYGVIASVMEQAAGQRFDRLIQQWVLGPLGAAGGFDAASLPPEQLAQLATLYRKQVEGQPWKTEGPWVPQTDDFSREPPKPLKGLADYKLGSNGTLFGPQGRLRISVRGMGAILQMLLAGGQHRGQAFLSPASIAALCTEQWRYDAKTANGNTWDGIYQAWGVGLQHYLDRSLDGRGDRLYPGLEAWGHCGFAWGLRSGLMFDAGRGNGIAYAISGTGADPDLHRARESSFPGFEEKLHRLLWGHLMKAQA